MYGRKQGLSLPDRGEGQKDPVPGAQDTAAYQCNKYFYSFGTQFINSSIYSFIHEELEDPVLGAQDTAAHQCNKYIKSFGTPFIH